MFRSAVLLACVAAAAALYGFDSTHKVDQAHFTCLNQNESLAFYIGRVWEEKGRFDTTGINNIKNALAVGYEAGALFFPCIRQSCAHADAQLEGALNRLKKEGITIDTVWIGVARGEWHDDVATNQQFTLDILAKADQMNQTVGIHTSEKEWTTTMGGNFTSASDRSLWWINHDDSPQVHNFTSFGGWVKPKIHQYKKEVDHNCGVRINHDYKKPVF